MNKLLKWMLNVAIFLTIVFHFLLLIGVGTLQIDTLQAIKVLGQTSYSETQLLKKTIKTLMEEQEVLKNELIREQKFTGKLNEWHNASNHDLVKLYDKVRDLEKEYDKTAKDVRSKLKIAYDNSKEPDFDKILKATILINNRERGTLGTGVLITYKGKKYVLSAFHLDSSKEIYADDGGRDIKLELVIEDAVNDLVLFKAVDEFNTKITYIPFVPATIKPGEHIWVCGNPMGITDAITSGIIVRESKDGASFLVDAPIWYGNSGGGIYNRKGNLIGIASKIMYDVDFNKASCAYGIFIHVDTIEKFLGQLR